MTVNTTGRVRTGRDGNAGNRRILGLVVCITGSVVTSLTPTTVVSQQQVVRGPATCRDCRITFSPVATIGSPDGPGYLEALPVSMARDSRGRIYVVAEGGVGDGPAVFDHDGSYVGRLGRRGSGPGEYRDPSRITVASGDTVLVFDGETRRLTVLSPDLEVAYTMPIESGASAAVLVGNRHVVINASIADWDRVGLPIHVYDRRTGYVRSFGVDQPGYSIDRLWELRRRLAVSGDSAVWATMEYRYELELWSVDGQRHTTLVREADWFPPRDEPLFATLERPPDPWVLAIAEEDGFLWVYIAVASEDWQQAVEPRKGEMGYQIYSYDIERLYDTIVEVIDPETNQLIAATRHPGFLVHHLGGGFVASIYDDEDGAPFAQTWKIELEGR